MKQPRGIDLLATLIDLYADQEGVKITYELESKAEYIDKSETRTLSA